MNKLRTNGKRHSHNNCRSTTNCNAPRHIIGDRDEKIRAKKAPGKGAFAALDREKITADSAAKNALTATICGGESVCDYSVVTSPSVL